MLRVRSNAVSTQLDHIKDTELNRKYNRDLKAATLFGQLSEESTKQTS